MLMLLTGKTIHDKHNQKEWDNCTEDDKYVSYIMGSVWLEENEHASVCINCSIGTNNIKMNGATSNHNL